MASATREIALAATIMQGRHGLRRLMCRFRGGDYGLVCGGKQCGPAVGGQNIGGCDLILRDGSPVGWVIVDRSGPTKPAFGCPFISLIEMNMETFPADKLPPDLVRIPAEKPGSK